MLKLNLGCGSHLLDDGFVNVDTREIGGAVKMDICALKYKDLSVDFIYSAHALQCLPDRDLVPVALKEWFRVLKRGATLIVEVPNVLPLLNAYIKGNVNHETFIQGFYGHNSPGNLQTTAFTPDYLVKLLTEAGFSRITFIQQMPYSKHDSKTNLSASCIKE